MAYCRPHRVFLFLIPSNEPHMLAMEIVKLSRDTKLMEQLSHQGQLAARQRHNPESIKNTLTDIYQKIISHQQRCMSKISDQNNPE